jgi:hypothetical protein
VILDNQVGKSYPPGGVGERVQEDSLRFKLRSVEVQGAPPKMRLTLYKVAAQDPSAGEGYEDLNVVSDKKLVGTPRGNPDTQLIYRRVTQVGEHPRLVG